MKKLAFLGAPLVLVALASHAHTYTISFLNSTGTTMTEKVVPNNKATHIECSGNCTSLPPNGSAIYKISNNESNLPEGASLTATFTNSGNSTYCNSSIEGMTIKYDAITNYSYAENFFINVGEALPNGLYGSIETIKKCAT